MNIRARSDLGTTSPYPAVVNVDVAQYNKIKNRSFFSLGNPDMSSSVAKLNSTKVLASINNIYANNICVNNISYYCQLKKSNENKPRSNGREN